MTNPTIPPCPKCGKQLTPSTYNGITCLVGTESCSGCHGYHSLMPEENKHWFDEILGRACRELGIETVEQLKARLAPDPRVAVLEAAIDAEYAEWDKDENRNSTFEGVRIAALAKRDTCYLLRKLIAAQRGEVVK